MLAICQFLPWVKYVREHLCIMTNLIDMKPCNQVGLLPTMQALQGDDDVACDPQIPAHTMRVKLMTSLRSQSIVFLVELRKEHLYPTTYFDGSCTTPVIYRLLLSQLNGRYLENRRLESNVQMDNLLGICFLASSDLSKIINVE